MHFFSPKISAVVWASLGYFLLEWLFPLRTGSQTQPETSEIEGVSRLSCKCCCWLGLGAV